MRRIFPKYPGTQHCTQPPPPNGVGSTTLPGLSPSDLAMRVAALLLVARLGLAASRLIRRAANAAPRGVLDHQECLGIMSW